MSLALLRSAAPPLARPDLCVERTDIRFENVAPDRVAFTVTLHNRGGATSEPTHALIQTAPLGAFVPWRPLLALWVPALDPGETVDLRDEVRYRPPAAFGSPNRVPPQRLLTALGMGDRRPRRDPGMADDLLRLLGQGGIHWAGNFNVFVAGRDVERHVAQALRVYPGRRNMADFIVGSGRRDAYAFHLEGDAVAWDARLYDVSGARSVASHDSSTDGIEDDAWVEMSTGIVMLALDPPKGAGAGSVEVHVRQRSTGREAVVEFGLDPKAAGPGCFVG
jgi:hypothetical protein